MLRTIGMAAGLAAGLAAIGAGAAVAQPAAADSQALALAGDWTGVLQGQPPTHVIVHVRPLGGGVAATYDNVERAIREVPLSDFRRDGAAVSFALPAAQIRYEGRLDVDGRTLKGSIRQGEAPAQPLDLSRAGK